MIVETKQHIYTIADMSSHSFYRYKWILPYGQHGWTSFGSGSRVANNADFIRMLKKDCRVVLFHGLLW